MITERLSTHDIKKCYCVRGMSDDFMRSYLSTQPHFVSLGNISSHIKGIDHGVPRGSVFTCFLHSFQGRCEYAWKFIKEEKNTNMNLIKRIMKKIYSIYTIIEN